MGAAADHLEALIQAQGPLTIARFMAEALAHPEHGYYMRDEVIGGKGDFITAPEISQMFGELLGLWCAATWQQMGEPKPVHLVELGPGRGTMMADLLRAAKAVPSFLDALRLHLIETSPALGARQRRTLAGSGALWHRRLREVPEGPLLLLANEFFDALPVQQFQRTERGWCERLVGLARNGEGAGGEARGFRLLLSARPTPSSALIPPAVRQAPPGSVAEICPEGLALARRIATRVAAHGGAALIIDYGRQSSAAGDSLRAVRGHRKQEPLEEPGSADLSAHVDFEAVGRAAGEAGARVHGPTRQGAFLRQLGIEARAEALLAGATPDGRIDIAAALGRLTDPTQMGSLFKVLSITHPDLSRLAGFGHAA